MNKIASTQNEKYSLKLRWAARHVNDSAMYIVALQFLLMVVVPLLLVGLTMAFEKLLPYVSVYSVTTLLLQYVLLEPLRKRLSTTGAKIGEIFDCIVLKLPPNHELTGSAVAPEDIHAAAREPKPPAVSNWYPTNLGELPLPYGRLVCQRSNLRYDRDLRKTYSYLLAVVAMAVLAAVLLVQLVRQATLIEFIQLLAVFAPLFVWILFDRAHNRDAMEAQRQLVVKCDMLRDRLLNGHAGASEAEVESRNIQNAVYTMRASTRPIPPLLYRWTRHRREEEMDAGAKAYVVAYENEFERRSRDFSPS